MHACLFSAAARCAGERFTVSSRQSDGVAKRTHLASSHVEEESTFKKILKIPLSCRWAPNASIDVSLNLIRPDSLVNPPFPEVKFRNQ